MPSERLTGKTAIVTGTSTGIGAAIVDQVCDAGARVLALDLAEPGEDLAAMLRRAGDSARFEHADVSDEADWRGRWGSARRRSARRTSS